MRKIKTRFILVTAFLLFISVLTPVSVAATSKDVMFGKVKVQKGMIKKITIVKETFIQKKDSKGKIGIVQKAKKGQEFGVFSKGIGLYQLGQGKFVKHSGAVKYAVIPKALLDQINKPIGAVSTNKPAPPKNQEPSKPVTKNEENTKPVADPIPVIDISKLNEVEKEYYDLEVSMALNMI
ncbi:hypothetical protein [Peribacillus acanthi]|uniref:hypothetical protein n=1 Tax=Peribacillus acanthi TaxID=2171554 RepID=UPI000D3E9A9C|nr:hypothetical protein [Peribacillus acanthi]